MEKTAFYADVDGGNKKVVVHKIKQRKIRQKLEKISL